MKKNEILENLDSARIAHIAWVNKAQLLVHGEESISKNQLPLDSRDCSFGRWFFNTGQVLFCIMNEQLVKSIESKHAELHNSYLQIFKIYFNQEEETFFILEQPKTIIEASQKQAEEELRNLENISEELIALLYRIESNFSHIDDEDLTGICF